MNRTVNGYNINYEWVGEGEETVVILQGWGTTYGLYHPIANALAGTCRVLLFNLPGFGESEEPREVFSVSDYADFFCAMMKEFGIEEATLMGHSFGGRIIIKLAARKDLPFRIRRIVLIDSAGIPSKKTLAQKYRIRKYKILKKLVNLRLAQKICPELIEEWKSRQGSADYRNSSPMMRKVMVSAISEDLTEYLSKISAETLLIWGEKDSATPLSDGKLMEERIPDSGLAVIPGAGHFCFAERPDIFYGILRSYFGTGTRNDLA
ncbi:MAG: alpha/beta hydrolase [Lachnospiraceae bacterium]|nr:alpha/beta hydrolase [Lachnospiraceae bacterium]